MMHSKGLAFISPSGNCCYAQGMAAVADIFWFDSLNWVTQQWW